MLVAIVTIIEKLFDYISPSTALFSSYVPDDLPNLSIRTVPGDYSAEWGHS